MMFYILLKDLLRALILDHTSDLNFQEGSWTTVANQANH